MKITEYNEGYDGTSNRGTVGMRAANAKCWDSGKEDKDAGKEKTPRCGSTPIEGGRKRRKTRRSKKSKKTKRRY